MPSLPLGPCEPTGAPACESAEQPRNRAICDAALGLLAELGYESMSMDAVASRAKASKATIYRHWSGKRELVIDALRLRGPASLETPDTGSLRGDLLAVLRQTTSGLMGQEVELLTGVLRALRQAPDLAEFVRSEMLEGKRAVSTTLTERAVARGELPPDADPDLFHEVAPALVFFRTTVLGLPVDEAYLAYVADSILIPLMSRPKTPAAGAPLKESA